MDYWDHRVRPHLAAIEALDPDSRLRAVRTVFDLAVDGGPSPIRGVLQPFSRELVEQVRSAIDRGVARGDGTVPVAQSYDELADPFMTAMDDEPAPGGYQMLFAASMCPRDAPISAASVLDILDQCYRVRVEQVGAAATTSRPSRPWWP